MNELTRYRVTYEAPGGSAKGTVRLSEIYECADLEDALNMAKDWANRLGWRLKAVEELAE